MDSGRQLDTTLVRSMGIIALFAATAGAVRLVQDVAIAWRFGTGPLVDAYYFALSLTTWPAAVALATLTATVAPAEAILKRDRQPILRFRAELLAWTLAAAAILIPIAWWATHTIVGGTAGLPREAADHASSGLPWLIAMVPLGIVGALLSAWFVASSRHSLTLLESLPPLVLVGAMLTATGPVLFWGTSAGVGVQVAVMALMLYRARELPAPRFGPRSSAWPGFWRGTLAMLAGQVLFAFVPLVDAFFAARLEEGTLGTLSYANRLILGLQGLVALSLRRAGLPLLSSLSARSPGESLRTAWRWATIAACTGILMALAMTILAEPVVSLLFERGSFTATDREGVAALLRFGMLQMPVFLGGIPIVAALTALQSRRALTLIPVSGLIAKVMFGMALVPSMGAAGLQIATALMYSVTSAVALLAMRGHVRRAASSDGKNG